MIEDAVALATSLRTEATRTNERRALVLAGDRERGYDVLEAVLDSVSVPITKTTLVGPEDRLRCEQVPQANAGELLGTTRDVLVLDAHEGLRPNALGKTVGAVDGGGLLVLLTPLLEEWPGRRGAFDESLAVPPFSPSDVTSRFRGRLVETLRAHRGIAIVDLEAGRVEDDGLTNPAPRLAGRDAEDPALEMPPDHLFPAQAYDACLTSDQAAAVAAFEPLAPGARAREGDGPDAGGSVADSRDGQDQDGRQRAVVLEADRGRGKSSAAGLAAGSLASDGADVLVTAPGWRNAEEVFGRARELCETLEVLETAESRRIRTTGGGCVYFLEPAAAIERLEAADVVIVDEAAALPVARLEALLAADRIAFATTIHGYEGAGRGFSVRFRDRLADSGHEVTDRTLAEPIRYAAGDPLEVWAFRALLLDARPTVDSLVADATPDSVEYRRLEPDDLFDDEQRLREAFGLLVLAHYRTEPNDLARLLDAPNLEARALVHDGHVVCIALLAREGGLSPGTRGAMYEGGRVRGNMLPDVLTRQLRDEGAGEPRGVRIVRIATHHEVRSRGLGSRLLECVHDEFADDDEDIGGEDDAVDWLGTGFGATPELLEFWRENGYRTIHVSTTRNDASGEHSALMLRPTSSEGRSLHGRHAEWFVRRFPTLCTDALADLEPDVVRAVLRSVDERATPPLDLSDHEWRIVAGAAYGPGLFDVDPAPFRDLAVRYLLEDPDAVALEERQERLLVVRVLQGRPWASVADRLEYPSTRQCMRALGHAFRPLVDHYGTNEALAVRDRFLET
ncbi:tRNA(Met) cytidine acetyltransferase TmcA [Natrarchaeobius chitinivorans]|uniref:tRNA(Met) cytidine acetyltransferase TmcA n=1 Tax=Natrarchaeobius chitinivorans TaxID=1679083 RepID=A0A3N6P518_NATCH|nr:tRNA(Met) cytidine acetyltransferase TmcA [Natrarchaeobius chitinivorans]RQG90595.1 tRNA(Met) cytidine acetyltransferase [Natrarchaeobius chitinivorans]